MARIPRSFARRARSTASIFLGTPSGSECACISIAPLRVCAFADSEKTRNIAASCDLMAVPFIKRVSLELGVDLTRSSHWLPRQCAIMLLHNAVPCHVRVRAPRGRTLRSAGVGLIRPARQARYSVFPFGSGVWRSESATAAGIARRGSRRWGGRMAFRSLVAAENEQARYFCIDLKYLKS